METTKTMGKQLKQANPHQKDDKGVQFLIWLGIMVQCRLSWVWHTCAPIIGYLISYSRFIQTTQLPQHALLQEAA